MLSVLSGGYKNIIDHVTIIDCRYPYEYQAGHIKVGLSVLVCLRLLFFFFLFFFFFFFFFFFLFLFFFFCFWESPCENVLSELSLSAY